MEIKLTKDEIAIMGTLYKVTRNFGVDDGQYWADGIFEGIGLNEKRYARAVSLLTQMKLMGRQKDKLAGPPPREGEWVWLTVEGIMAYRANVPENEWDIVPEWTKDED